MNSLVKQATAAYICLILVVIAIGVRNLPKAYASNFVENVHYVTLKQEATPESEIKVFYSPYCKPCAAVHTPLRIIAERAEVEFVDVPVKFGPMGEDFQASIAIANKQKVGHEYVDQLLKNIHYKPSNAPQTREDLAKLIESCGGDSVDFRQGCKDVQQDIATFDKLTEQYRITATPTIVVNGNKQIKLTSLKSMSELEQLIFELSGS
ncbi:DsbA family protein [Vibrio sp. HN007]|uniref:DsbA family protein n=1 Tax=Vibrio iocasae TaxID=3098914 RepID=UPI0035D521C9